ncbi:MAG: hypothetical protein EA402_01455 [Planctomycetota bacterium]|nr:MAG: hypothetical protein EA402_01455 [Planctomycetota bacterium]
MLLVTAVMGLPADEAEDIFINLINGYHLRVNGEHVEKHQIDNEAGETVHGVHRLMIDGHLLIVYVGNNPNLDLGNDDQSPLIKDDFPWAVHPTDDWRFQYWDTESWLHILCDPKPYHRDEDGRPNQGHRAFVIHVRKPSQFTVVNIWSVIDIVHDPERRYQYNYSEAISNTDQENFVMLEINMPLEWRELFLDALRGEIISPWAAVMDAGAGHGDLLTDEHDQLIVDAVVNMLTARYPGIDFSDGIKVRMLSVDK